MVKPIKDMITLRSSTANEKALAIMAQTIDKCLAERTKCFSFDDHLKKREENHSVRVFSGNKYICLEITMRSAC